MTSLKKRILIASTAAALLAGASLSAFAMGGGDRCDGPGAGQSGPRAEKMHKMMNFDPKSITNLVKRQM